MRVIRIHKHRVTTRVLAEVEATLRAGGTVVFPTETSYGIAADPFSRAAVRRVYAIKGRPASKPLPLIAASRAAVMRTFRLSDAPPLARLAARHWPGALTLVLPLRRGVRLPALASRRDGAVRVPASAWARAVALACGGLVTSTSANRSGDDAIYDSREVIRAFDPARRGERRRASDDTGDDVRPDLLLDAGMLPRRAASTIVRLRGTGRRATTCVLRQGSVRVNATARAVRVDHVRMGATSQKTTRTMTRAARRGTIHRV